LTCREAHVDGKLTWRSQVNSQQGTETLSTTTCKEQDPDSS
jgi:hypothetical protein